MNMQCKSLVYIAGFGRSGSTITECLLVSALPGYRSLGEIHAVFDILDGKTPLGEEFIPKDISSILKQYPKSLLDAANDYQKNYMVYKLMPRFCNAEKKRLALKKLLTDLFNSFPENSFIDSSKTTRETLLRPLMLADLFPQLNIKIIHLTRSLRSVIQSTRKVDNRKAMANANNTKVKFAAFRTIFHWPLTEMLTIFLYNYIFPASYLRIFFPFNRESLEKLLSFLNVSTSESLTIIENVEKGFTFENKFRGVAGNRASMARTFAFKLRNE